MTTTTIVCGVVGVGATGSVGTKGGDDDDTLTRVAVEVEAEVDIEVEAGDMPPWRVASVGHLCHGAMSSSAMFEQLKLNKTYLSTWLKITDS
jgi:hypothetical protein